MKSFEQAAGCHWAQPEASASTLNREISPSPEDDAARKARRSQVKDQQLDDYPSKSVDASESVDGSDELCSRCRSLDLDALLAKVTNGNGPFEIGPFSTNPNCGLCRLLSSDEDPSNSLHLRAYSAKKIFGIESAIEIQDCALLAVTSSYWLRLAPRSEGTCVGLWQSNDLALSLRAVPSSIDWRLPNGWLDFCVTQHGRNCNGMKRNGIPGLRVVNCLTRDIVSLPRNAPYVTLSYLWGKTDDLSPPLESDQLPVQTPNTIEDALLATVKLGFRYIWIDRYCIRQDHPLEKAILLKEMGAIFADSALTIIAAAGEDPSHGIPGINRPRNLQDKLKIGNRILLKSCPVLQNEVQDSQWNTRGWTFQESLLSRRRLLFTDNQIYFQCPGMHCLESLYAPLAPLHVRNKSRYRESVSISTVFPTHGIGKWPSQIQDRISEFMVRELSFESDALEAFLGILHEFERMKHPIYHLQGIPLFPREAYRSDTPAVFRLAHSLTWFIEGKAIRRPTFPSWTWVGWKLIRSDKAFPMPLFRVEGNAIWDQLKAGTCRYIDASGRVAVVDISIDYHFEDGTPANFAVSGNQMSIKEVARLPAPECIRLSGWTFVFSVTLEEIGWLSAGETTRSFLKNLGLTARPKLMNPEYCTVGEEWPYTALIMTCEEVGPLQSAPYPPYTALLLTEVRPSVFERVGTVYLSLDKSVSGFDVNAAFEERLDRREICLV